MGKDKSLAREWCIRCGRPKKWMSGWCDECHQKVVAEIEARKAIPPGCNCPTARVPVPRRPTSYGLGFSGPRYTGPALCTGCGRLGPVSGHICGRPFCGDCLNPNVAGTAVPVSHKNIYEHDASPGEESAVRALEDALGWEERDDA